MNDRAGLWAVRGVFAVLAAVLLWWGATTLGASKSLAETAVAHANEHHGGGPNGISEGSDMLSDLAHVFGGGAVVLGLAAAIAAVFPYRRGKAKGVEQH
jgi:hypothetical protein